MKLSNKKIAILANDGYEQSELEKPMEALKNEGAEVQIISLKQGEIKSMKGHEWDRAVKVDKMIAEADPNDYDALILPGGVINPDALRVDDGAVKFVKNFMNSGKTVGAICHGPQTLIDADVVKGKKLTSFKAISKDLQNAGAEWVDEEVVTDGNLTTSRKPDDIPAFNARLIEEISK